MKKNCKSCRFWKRYVDPRLGTCWYEGINMAKMVWDQCPEWEIKPHNPPMKKWFLMNKQERIDAMQLMKDEW